MRRWKDLIQLQFLRNSVVVAGGAYVLINLSIEPFARSTDDPGSFIGTTTAIELWLRSPKLILGELLSHSTRLT